MTAIPLGPTTKRCCEHLTSYRTVASAHNWVRRFLRARKFHLKQAKLMFGECQEWRRTVQGMGIDELYQRIDPFDVSFTLMLAGSLLMGSGGSVS